MFRRLLSGLLIGKATASGTISQAQLTHWLEQTEAFLESANLADALELWRETSLRHDLSAEATAWLGAQLGMRGELSGARECLEAAVSLQPDYKAAWMDLGNVALLQKDTGGASRAFTRAAGLSSENADALFGLARTELQRNDDKKAEPLLRAVLAKDADNLDALDALVGLLDRQEDSGSAARLIETALISQPDHPRFNFMMGFLTYKRFFQPEKALEYLERAALSPNIQSDPSFWVSKGICWRDVGNTDEAREHFKHALMLDPANPQALFHRGLNELYLGNFDAGWPDYEARFSGLESAPVEHPSPRWKGEPLAKNWLHVIGEQGIGDEIMFASCIPDILAAGARVSLECTAKLVPIFAASFPHVQVVPKGQSACLSGTPDWHIPIGSLPAYLRRDGTRFPRKAYLSVPPSRIEGMRARLETLGEGIKIGLSWRGGVEKSRTRLRSIPPEELAPLARHAGIHWINLQYGDCEADVIRVRESGMNLVHWPDILDDYAETAALTAALDGVLSVCTSLVHLAGALGQRVVVLAPHVPEWRYGLHNERMIWYPFVEILRQQQTGSWKGEIEQGLQRFRSSF